MEVKKTVMDMNQWLDRNGIDKAYKKDMKKTYEHLKPDLEAQAEISFKVGYDKGRTVCPTNEVQGTIYLEGKQSGRQEVVDYIEEQNDLEDEEPLPYYVMNKKVWQAQKKEWGL